MGISPYERSDRIRQLASPNITCLSTKRTPIDRAAEEAGQNLPGIAQESRKWPFRDSSGQLLITLQTQNQGNKLENRQEKYEGDRNLRGEKSLATNGMQTCNWIDPDWLRLFDCTAEVPMHKEFITSRWSCDS
jgi:hypothetical protein